MTEKGLNGKSITELAKAIQFSNGYSGHIYTVYLSLLQRFGTVIYQLFELFKSWSSPVKTISRVVAVYFCYR